MFRTVDAHNEKISTFEGTFGEREVLMEIVNSHGFYKARYCFRDDLNDVFLETSYDGSHYILVSSRFNKEAKKYDTLQEINIKKEQSQEWTGTWKAPSGDEYKVALHPVTKDSLAFESKDAYYKNSMTLYAFCRLKNIQYNVVEEQRFKHGLRVEWLEEKNSGVKGFRIVDGLSDSSIKKINEYLEIKHLQDIESYFGCGTVAFDGWYKQEIKITYLSPRLLSFTKSEHKNCFNAEEPVYNEYFTIDLNTRNILSIENLLWMGESEQPRNGSMEYFEYRRNIFSKAIEVYIRENYEKEIKESGCDYTDRKIYVFPQFYLTPKGMILKSDYYSLSEQCKSADWMLISFKDFKKFWNRKYL